MTGEMDRCRPLVSACSPTSPISLCLFALLAFAITTRPAAADEKARVLIFTTIDCPISNRYAPEIIRLSDEFARQGIPFSLVFANPADTQDAIDAHVERFGYRMPAIRDPDHALVKQIGVTIAPEAAVLDANGQVLYRGRIDDRYISFGIDRPVPTRRDLREALSAIVAGKPVEVREAQAVGCFLADFVPKPPTFASDIASILFEACASCHRPGGPGPFSLLTHADAQRHATQIVQVTKSRFMPPWKTDAGDGPFVAQRRLTDREIALIEDWVAAGTPAGNPSELPKVPSRTDGWQLGTPDLVVTIPTPYSLQAEPTDVFRIFAIPLPIDGVRYVRGLEFLPGNARVVHHANIRLDYTVATRTLDARDPGPGYDGLMPRSAVYPEGHFLGWTPEQLAPLVPGAFAWRLQPGADLVVLRAPRRAPMNDYRVGPRDFARGDFQSRAESTAFQAVVVQQRPRRDGTADAVAFRTRLPPLPKLRRWEGHRYSRAPTQRGHPTAWTDAARLHPRRECSVHHHWPSL